MAMLDRGWLFWGMTTTGPEVDARRSLGFAARCWEKSGHAEPGLSALSAVAQFHYERRNMALGGITPMQKLALAA